MAFPKAFRDDGDMLFLDVHGNTIPDALALIRRAVERGGRAGRSRLEVVHGFSTTRSAYERTIKNAIVTSWESGEYEAWVADVRQDDVGGLTVFWFKIGQTKDAQRLTPQDIVPL